MTSIRALHVDTL